VRESSNGGHLNGIGVFSMAKTNRIVRSCLNNNSATAEAVAMTAEAVAMSVRIVAAIDKPKL